MFLLCVLMYWIFLTPTTLTPIERWIRTHFPRWLQVFIMFLPPVSHTVETILLLPPRLYKYRVPHGKVRAQWIVASLLTGSPVFRQFDKIAEEEKRILEARLQAEN